MYVSLTPPITFDPKNNYGFVADYSGQINVLKLDTTGFQFVTTLKGHQSKLLVLTKLERTSE